MHEQHNDKADERESIELHKRAQLLGLVDHDEFSPDQLRAAIRAREQGADPHQAQGQVEEGTPRTTGDAHG
ncbi:hypothetical protein UO65_1453 [Actinokineospora spheciospongiae]|uniref:Uncharacterized protein n=1 Tax=Actinokineospora spheciospongiae TaxID=909613 RepID=W7JB12_9PSEU|nr:hypothetical protein [Actinokineospora spheciospongiae]EWC63239.1 hypothetical protein UO65_1453 [Actinokineospora spheciospongiae]